MLKGTFHEGTSGGSFLFCVVSLGLEGREVDCLIIEEVQEVLEG